MKKVKAVRLPLDLEICYDFEEYVTDCMDREDDVKNVHFLDGEVEGKSFPKNDFENVLFENCTFHRLDLKYSFYTNVHFKKCSFIGCDFSSSYFRQCKMENSQFKNSTFSQCSFSDLEVADTAMRYANLTQSKFKVCNMVKSDLSESFFAQCSLEHFTVDNCNFTSAEFFKTKLSGIDFTTSNILGISVSEDYAELKGMIVDLYQGAELVKLLGVVVKE